MINVNIQRAARTRSARTGEKYTIALAKVGAELAALDRCELVPIDDAQHAAHLADIVMVSLSPSLDDATAERIRGTLIPAFQAAGYPEQATRITYQLDTRNLSPEDVCVSDVERYIDGAALVGYIVANTGLPSDVVQVVLDVEEEHMVGLGLIDLPEEALPYEFTYYDATTLPKPSNCLDTLALAQDVERFTGIPFDTALDILFWDGEYLMTAGRW